MFIFIYFIFNKVCAHTTDSFRQTKYHILELCFNSVKLSVLELIPCGLPLVVLETASNNSLRLEVVFGFE